MPELPEVETVRRGLEQHVAGRTIDAVEVLHPRAVRRHVAGPADFAAALRGRQVAAPRRRGKYLWLPGRRRRAPGSPGHERPAAGRRARTAPLSPHVRVRFTFTDGGPDLRFIDQRTFGHLLLEPPAARELPARRSRTSPRDPLEAAFDRAAFAAAAAHAAYRHQAGAARPVADQRGRQHLRRRGAVAGAAALGAGRPTRCARPDVAPAARRRARGLGRGAAAPAGPRSTASTSTSTARAATSTARWPCTAARASRARGAATPVRRDPFMNRSSYSCPVASPGPAMAAVSRGAGSTGCPGVGFQRTHDAGAGG